ncbi:DUF7848 domain-containing protein [Streptomyces buecherae]|uniref:DUF7848 domain-containing protein n=1 Tax=Streptomyces buecherae TaxID=2763006 RepID=UPI003FD76075
MTRSPHRYVEMVIDTDESRPPSAVRAACVTCGERSPEPEEGQDLERQYVAAQDWCARHTGRDHADGRHTRFTATAVLRWVVTPTEDIGPLAGS